MWVYRLKTWTTWFDFIEMYQAIKLNVGVQTEYEPEIWRKFI